MVEESLGGIEGILGGALVQTGYKTSTSEVYQSLSKQNNSFFGGVESKNIKKNTQETLGGVEETMGEAEDFIISIIVYSFRKLYYLFYIYTYHIYQHKYTYIYTH